MAARWFETALNFGVVILGDMAYHEISVFDLDEWIVRLIVEKAHKKNR